MHELGKDTVLWTRLLIFIYDLHKFSSNPQCAERLNLTTSPDYISEPYFDKSQASRIRDTVVEGRDTTVKEVLRQWFQDGESKNKETNDHGVCTNHHLAPIHEEAFGVNGRELGKDKKFMKVVKKVDKRGLWALDGKA